MKIQTLALREALATFWWIALIVILGFVAAYQFVEPAPPTTLTISTGSKSGAYFHFAGRYADILARNGIRLEILESAGSIENLKRLENGEADIAFVQGGILPAQTSESEEQDERPLRSLGSMYYEPVWVFYRGEPHLSRLTQLKGKRIAIGQEGSGVRQLALQLLQANAMVGEAASEANLLPLSGVKAAEALEKGQIDAAFIIAAQEAPVVQRLINAQGIHILSFGQAEAYRRRFPFLSTLTLPEGVADLVRNNPPRDVALLSPTANLVVRQNVHPALQSLLLQAAAQVHGQPGFFQRTGEFPAHKDHMLALTPEAARYYKSGPPFLQRYLPFWLAVLIERLVVLLVPIVALLIPLAKAAPAIYNWRIRTRIFRYYGELKVLEIDIREHYQPQRRDEFRQRLDKLEETARAIHVPLTFSDLVFTLREHIQLVRKILGRMEEGNA